jgi:hypothetical protein
MAADPPGVSSRRNGGPSERHVEYLQCSDLIAAC